MDNRFTFKDFVYVLLLVTIIVMLGLKMVQDDRQWERFSTLSIKIDEQTRDLASLRRLIGEGAIAPRPAGDGDAPRTGGTIFRRVRQAQQLPGYAPGDWFVDSFTSAPPKLNYLTAQDVYSRVVYCRVLESLATFDIEKLELVPMLAASWEVADDGLSMTVKLRRDVIFSDGVPMTADDVVHTWSLNKNPDIADGRTLEYLRFITAVEKIDDYTVKFTFSQVHYENALRALEEVVLPKHFFEKYTAQQIRDHPALLLGTGPYRLPDPERYTPGDQIELVRNERYWGPPPPWDRMVWRLIEKDSAQEIAFRNREIDIFAPTPEQHEVMVNDKPLLDRTQHYIYEQVRTGYTYIGWNQQRAGKPTVFTDARVRRAMTLMLDRQRIADEIFLGYSRVADGPFSHLSDQHNPDIQPWPYDPDAGVKLLMDAGFKKGGDGVMRKPDGSPFRVKLTYPSGSEFYQKIMLMAKDNYARAGVLIDLDPQEWSLLLETLNNKDFEAIILGWGAGGIEGDIEQMFHTRTIEQGDNRNAYSNPELDKLIDEAHVTLDYDARMAIWRKCHAILHEDQPYTFLFRAKSRIWLDKRFANVQEMPALGLNYVSTWPTPIEWYVPREKQLRGKNGP